MQWRELGSKVREVELQSALFYFYPSLRRKSWLTEDSRLTPYLSAFGLVNCFQTTLGVCVCNKVCNTNKNEQDEDVHKIQRTLLWFLQLKVSRPGPIFRQIQLPVFAWRCICLKIGLGRETFSCENHRSVRWILWKALQSGRALFRWEDYYIARWGCNQTSRNSDQIYGVYQNLIITGFFLMAVCNGISFLLMGLSFLI